MEAHISEPIASDQGYRELLLRQLAAWLRSWLWLAVAVSAICLIILHMVFDDLRIDTVTVALLGLIIASPYIPLMRRIRFGEFEAELGPDTISKAERDVDAAAPEASSPPGGSLRDLADELQTLVEVDPAIALAKLRIELERILAQLLESKDPTSRSRRLGVRGLVNELSRLEVVDKETAEAVLSLVNILNRAVHGATIQQHDADRVISLGIRLLDHFGDILAGVLEPLEREVISREEEQSAASGLYRVVTVVPLVENPERRTYVLTQEQLDSFLEGYDEYAEYIVRVEPLDAPAITDSHGQ